MLNLLSPQPSPVTSRHGSPTRTSVEKDHENVEEKTKSTNLSSWFQGESQPIKVSLVPSPIGEDENPLEPTTTMSSTRPTSMPHRRRSTSLVLPAMARRFSFFGSKASLSKPTPPTSDKVYDDFFKDDINSILFHKDAPDPSSPAAFKELHQRAETVITKLQASYKEQATALKDTLAENDALSEENQGAETRARHLKMQLNAMAEQLAEQDKAMMAMVDELAQEKLARREEEEARKKSIRFVEKESTPSSQSRPRRSTVSDSGFESEDDSPIDSLGSVFSNLDGTYSPTTSMSSISTDNTADVFLAREVAYSPTHAARLRVPPNSLKIVHHSCKNCHGVRPADAWPVVGVLKDENQGLKQRLQELEGALDGALDLVGG